MPARQFALAGASISVFQDSETASAFVADSVAAIVADARTKRGGAVLGLPTGSTPLPMYRHLVELARAGRISFRDVSTYNLDEYYPISPLDPNSYRHYMGKRLFDAIEIPANRAHVFDGTVPAAHANNHAAEFDRWIASEGGLDLQLLGIGRNGHIGFNEPTDLSAEQAAALSSRLVELHPVTRQDAIADFGSLEKVPTHALTLGPAVILAARKIIILAFGAKKAEIVRKSLTGPITAEVPASLLRLSNAEVHWILDTASASELS